MTPRSRAAGKTHEVREFATVQAGVDFYVHNINTGHAYVQLRILRAELRKNEERLSGISLATGLTLYSERGQHYVDEIQRMISGNKLSAYNVVRTATSGNG